jgi:outer membrane protein OmpA-like peptidoglycan-associated protein
MLIRIITIILALLVLSFYCPAQSVITEENADCSNPIELEDTVFGPTNAPEGFGKVMEITADKTSLYYFEKEHNTVWYKFTVPQTCVLTFDIIPTDISNDYDFLLFKYTDENFCRDVKDKKIKPIRSNISRNDKGINSMTGLSKDSTVTFVHSGPGRQYSEALYVNDGDIYYLVVDNVYENGSGHTIKLHYSDCSGPVISIRYTGVLNLTIEDLQTKLPLYASVDIYLSTASSEKRKEYEGDSITNSRIKLDNRQKYYLIVTAPGYMNYTEEINFEKGKNTIDIIACLDKIGIGKSFKIENIFFVADQDKILYTSKPALKHLLDFMKQNSTVKIEIQGHMNWPSNNYYSKPTKKDEINSQRFSEKRAQAVKDFLVKNNIEEDRITCKGYGYSKMLYPHTKRPRQEQQNRRVEIKILEE